MGVALVLLVLALFAVVGLLATRPAAARSSPRARPSRPPAARGPARTPATGSWPRLRWRGEWVHDVLLLERGVLLRRITSLSVRMPEEALRNAWPGEIRGLGLDPVVVLLRLDDDNLVEVAAPSEHRGGPRRALSGRCHPRPAARSQRAPEHEPLTAVTSPDRQVRP